MLGHQTLQRHSFNLLRSIQRSPRPEGAEHSGIKQIELLVLDQLTQGTPLKHRYPIAQQKVFREPR
jgi:hypothetical protein